MQSPDSNAGFFSPMEASASGLSGFETPPETESDDGYDSSEPDGVMGPAKMRLNHGLMEVRDDEERSYELEKCA